MSHLDGILGGVSTRPGSPVLVGRASEMAALRAAFAQVRQGSPAALLIGGEAGAGKSRLLGEFAEQAHGEDARVLAGGCLELGAEGLPFAPFTAVLRGLVRDIGAEAVGLGRLRLLDAARSGSFDGVTRDGGWR